MEIKLEFKDDSIDDDLKAKMLARLKHEVNVQIKDPAREIERKRLEMKLAAKSRL